MTEGFGLTTKVQTEISAREETARRVAFNAQHHNDELTRCCRCGRLGNGGSRAFADVRGSGVMKNG